MELREACRPPLLVFGRNGGSGLRSAGIRRSKISLLPPPHFCYGMPVTKYFKTTQMHIINYAHKSAASTLKGCSPIAFLGLCKVMWVIKADVADGQILYITGDPVALGCWNPEMAIPLSPSNGHAHLWNAEIKVPFGIHFKYNYFIKEKDKPSNDVVWRPGPEFSISIPFPSKQSEYITVSDLWLKKRIRNPVNSLWSSWISDNDHSSKVLKMEDYQTSQTVD